MPYSTAAGDIWSLGIILTNMICGRQPWQRATSIDETFYRFLTEKESLLEELAISHDAAVLLTKIFTFGSANRISLADLRKEILEKVVKKVIPANLLDDRTVYHVSSLSNARENAAC